MTSKALEAAIAALGPMATYGTAEDKARIRETVVKIIRAFGQNISEDAASECEIDWSGCNRQCEGVVNAKPEQVLAAIEEDLK